MDVKNSIGGEFAAISSDKQQVRIRADRCPFGESVHSAPGLCHITSSIFGGIAARNFAYAKVELQSRIALGSDGCDICIHLDTSDTAEVLGDEYFSDAYQVIAEVRAPDELQKVIEQRLHTLWSQDLARQTKEDVSTAPCLITTSAQMRDLLRAVGRIADTRATVLLNGESGVGKEILARSIHGMSSRLQQSFVAVNCGCLPADLVESELFGHERGAFTDAKQSNDKAGSNSPITAPCFWTKSTASRQRPRCHCYGYCKMAGSSGSEGISRSPVMSGLSLPAIAISPNWSNVASFARTCSSA